MAQHVSVLPGSITATPAALCRRMPVQAGFIPATPAPFCCLLSVSVPLMHHWCKFILVGGGSRLESIGAVLVAAVAVLCVTDESVYGTPGTSSAGSQVGFALTYALSVTAQLSAFVMAFTACETTLVSARRFVYQASSVCVHCLLVCLYVCLSICTSAARGLSRRSALCTFLRSRTSFTALCPFTDCLFSAHTTGRCGTMCLLVLTLCLVGVDGAIVGTQGAAARSRAAVR